MSKNNFFLGIVLLLLSGCGKNDSPIITIYLTKDNNDSSSTDSSREFNFTQGNFKVTSIYTDLSIYGKGLFILKKAGKEVYFRRPGRFYIDPQGYWVLSGDSSARLQALPLTITDSNQNSIGYQTYNKDSVSMKDLSDLRVTIKNGSLGYISNPHATTNVRYGCNLDSDGEGLGTIVHTSRFLASAGPTLNPTISDPKLISLFDSQGNSLGIRSGDVLTVRAANEAGNMSELAPPFTVTDSATLSHLVAAIGTVLGQIDSQMINNIKIQANGSITIDARDRASPINNLQVTSSRPGSNSYVANAFSWGPHISNAPSGSSVNSDQLRRSAQNTDLIANVYDASGNLLGLEVGDIISINGAVGGKTIATVELTYAPLTTMQDLLTAIQQAFKLPSYYDSIRNLHSVTIIPPNTADNNFPDGSIAICGQQGSPFALQNISISASNSNQNAIVPSRFNANLGTLEVQPARDALQIATSIIVFDASGKTHSMKTTFTHSGKNGIWNWEITMEGSEKIVAGNSGTISFLSDGSPETLSFDDHSSTFKFKSDSDSLVVSISLDIGSPGLFTGLTQFRSSLTAVARIQDGYPLGTPSEVYVDLEGTLSVFFTNGTSLKLYKIPIASFLNWEQLSFQGTYFEESKTSGPAIVTLLDSASTTSLRDMVLEEETH